MVHLDPEHMRISVRSGRGDADGIACFAELTCSKIFLEHRIESAANDAIVFEIDLHMFKTALQSILHLLAGTSTSTTLHGRSSNTSSIPNNNNNLQTSTATAASYISLHNSSLSQSHVVQAASSLPFLSSQQFIVMKLAKRAGLPCLCLCTNGSMQLEQNHSVPIKVMRTAEMQYHLPPRVSQPDVQLELPTERSVRTVVERLKSISPHVFVEGSMTGDLVLRIEGEGASIRTFYNKLIPRFEDTKLCSSQNNNNNEGETVTATCVLKVDSKKLYACFQWQASLAFGRAVSSAVLCMIENEMLVLHVLLNPGDLGFLTYYVPVHFISGDAVLDN